MYALRLLADRSRPRLARRCRPFSAGSELNGHQRPKGPALAPPPLGQTVTVHFVDPNLPGPASRTTVQAPVGASIVDVAKEHGVDIHAACGQKLQCATCHVILQKRTYDLLPPKGPREEDMLESTFTLTPTSRLGCQVRLTPELDGIECVLPHSSGKGMVRMTTEQSRPQVNGVQHTPLPAVAPRVKGGSHELATMRRQLAEQRRLTAFLESELQQLRAKPADKPSSSSSSSSSKQAEGGEEDDDSGLEKLKKELQGTRVQVQKGANFEDVIGLEQAKQTLHEALVWPAVADASLFAGVRGQPRGVLLYGPPGCGKTMLARAAALELQDRASFFHVRPGDVMSKFYGDSQKRVRALEALVAEASPAVVFLDEVDALLGSRDGNGVAEHHRATTNALLAWMDGFGTAEQRVFFLGATNRPEAIDEAALRRFGDAVEVGAPSLEARLALLRHLVQTKASREGHRAAVSDADLEAVAGRTEGYSLADLDRLVRRAFLEVLRRLPPPGVVAGMRPADVPAAEMSHFEAALGDSRGTSALKELLRQKAKTRAQL